MDKKKAALKVARRDKIAGWVIKLISFTVIFSVLGIFANLFWMVIPLMQPSSAKALKPLPFPQDTSSSFFPQFALVPESNLGLVFRGDGQLEVWDVAEAKLQNKRSLIERPFFIEGVEHLTNISLFSKSGKAEVFGYQKDQSDILLPKASFTFNPEDFLYGAVRIVDKEKRIVLVKKSGAIELRLEKEQENFAGEVTRQSSTVQARYQMAKPIGFAVNQAGDALLMVNQAGDFELWRLQDAITRVSATNLGITGVKTVRLLYGEETYLIETDEKLYAFMNKQGQPGALIERSKIAYPGLLQLAPATTDRTLALMNQNEVSFFQSTTSSNLLDIKLEHKPSKLFLFSANKKVGYASNDQLFLYDYHLVYPDVGIKAYFSPLLYEGYDKPRYVWQSSSAREDYEPKISLIPIIVGSIKASFYALLIGFPLGVLGAIYLSQFAHPSVRRYCKPFIEMLSIIPSVVFGLLAALWLGPFFERNFFQILVSVLLFPVFFLLFRQAKSWYSQPFWNGKEFLLAAVPLGLAILGGYLIGQNSDLMFEGSFTHYLFETLGIKYEQQNTMITAIILGLASIPIIFSITDDALRSVPESLRAASFALGASKWQTVVRVIIPSASSGIFAAFMLGISRTVGETMIVLMASGNTALTDFSLFTGMRTLAANIAVEIVEAPVGGYLYRTLFFSALLLFLFTFIINSLAEAIRFKLKQRFRS